MEAARICFQHLHPLQTPLRPGKCRCCSLQHRGACTNAAFREQRWWACEAGGDGAGVSSTAGLPISLVTCGWSNSFIHAASRRNSSMSVEVKMSAGRKGHCKFSSLVLRRMAPKDITDNDPQKLALCEGFAHPPRPTARWASLQQGRAWHFHLGRSAVSMHQRHLVNCFLAEERPAN